MRILQVSPADVAGGAESVARQLFTAYQKRGHTSWLAVGSRQSDDDNILLIANDLRQNIWAKTWLSISDLLLPATEQRGVKRLVKILRGGVAHPGRWFNSWQGRENFHYPGTYGLLSLTAQKPDIVHCHNLHAAWLPAGGYFDLRVLPSLCHHVPVVMTLHDAWLISGHCAYPFQCDRWRTGCGHCPDLTIYPAVNRDATAFNWRRKKNIYSKCGLYVATPSQWLMDKVQDSILAPAILGSRVIPNGVDTSVFHPGNKKGTREALGLPLNARVVLFAATVPRHNRWKDFQTIQAAVTRFAGRLNGQQTILIVVGEKAPSEQSGRAEIRFVPHLNDSMVLAQYYRAADAYVHAAHVESWGLTISEAIACGTPVVATAVGGIPEQVEDGVTGFLVRPGDFEAMAARLIQLFSDESLRAKLEASVLDRRSQFSLDHQVDTYLRWYQEIGDNHSSRTKSHVTQQSH